MSTNIQSFSGDVDITSNVLMSSNVFIKSPGPTSNVVTIGRDAGLTDQGIDTVSIGTDAGKTGQNTTSIAIGYQAGFDAQDVASIAIGLEAGESDQGDESIAIGKIAGQTSQGRRSIAIGQSAAADGQNTQSIAIGGFAGSVAQGIDSIAIGRSSGQTTQANGTVAIGTRAGVTNQGEKAVAIGYDCGSSNQGSEAIAIGNLAGCSNQDSTSIAIGPSAGRSDQNRNCVAIGLSAGATSQGQYGIAIGQLSGSTNQSSSGVAVGVQAGRYNQGQYGVALGWLAGRSQGYAGVYAGYYAGRDNNNSWVVAIGGTAAQNVNGTGGGQAVCVGHRAGERDPAVDSVAVGYLAGQAAMGNRGLALGKSAVSGTVAHSDTIVIGPRSNTGGSSRFYVGAMRDATGSEYVHYSGGELVRGNNYSDDRLKFNEKYITGAIKSLFKIRPQTYDMKPKINADHDDIWKFEAGVIAQDIYYQVPELRHLVNIPLEAGDIDSINPVLNEDPTIDPDYSVWGPKPASVKYQQFIPYLIKAVQEIVTELPRSKTTASNTWGQNLTGLIVSANTNKHKTNTIPMVNVSNVSMDKSWYGVVTDKTTDTNDYDILVDTSGPTRIWVSDVGGQLESGDLITTSNIVPGYGQKQADDIIRNYTVAKVTQDCDFTEPIQNSIMVPRRELSNVTYYRQTVYKDITLHEWEKINDLHKRIRREDSWVAEGTCMCETCDFGTREEYCDMNGKLLSHEEYHAMTDEQKSCCTHTTEELKEDLNCHCEYYDGDIPVSEQKYDTLTEEEKQNLTMKWMSYLTPSAYEKTTEEMKTKYTWGTRPFYEQIETSTSRTQLPDHDEVIEIQEMVDVLDENGQIVWEETEQTEPIYTLVDHGTHKAALLTCKFV
jgi:hypothetical protein